MENNYKTIVYMTVNTVNNKIYIGVHNTENPDKFDGYIGNGVNVFHPYTIKHPTCPFHYAVKKYGFKKFKRYILQVFDNREDALKLEKVLVNEDFIRRDDTYNIINKTENLIVYSNYYSVNVNYGKLEISNDFMLFTNNLDYLMLLKEN